MDVHRNAVPDPRGVPSALGVAVVGLGWMGRVHTQAYVRVRHHFPDVPRVPHLVVAADAVPGRAAAAAEQYGFARATEDWRAAVADPQVQAVSVTLPNDLHRVVGAEVARAGKHLWIEKPVGLTTDDAATVAAAVAEAGVHATVGFNYRHVPAVDRAREVIAAGGIGQVTHARVRLFSDYAASPDGALTWRYERARGGSGVLGDLASHGVDLVRHLLGEVVAISADTAVFLAQRARPLAETTGHVRGGGELGPVENDDYVACLLRLASGARVVLEASRVAVGAQNDYGFEVHGTAGSLSWDFRRMGELLASSGSAAQDQSVTTEFVGPAAGAYGAFQPGAANPMSYDDLKVVEAHAFLCSIADGVQRAAGLADAVRAQQVLDAAAESAARGRWLAVGPG